MRLKNTKILQVFDHGSAQQAGLASGDEIIAIDNIKANKIEKQLSRYQTQDTIIITAFRRDKLMHFSLHLQPPKADTCDLHLVDNPNKQQWEQRKAWLKLSNT
jgi:predicted metalloprotease with PDZ domain